MKKTNKTMNTIFWITFIFGLVMLVIAMATVMTCLIY